MGFQARKEGKEDMSQSANEINVIADRTRSKSQDRERQADVPLNRGRSLSRAARAGNVSRSSSRGAKSESTIPASPDFGEVQEAEKVAAKEAADREAREKEELEAGKEILAETARFLEQMREAQRKEERRALVLQTAQARAAAQFCSRAAGSAACCRSACS